MQKEDSGFKKQEVLKNVSKWGLEFKGEKLCVWLPEERTFRGEWIKPVMQEYGIKTRALKGY